MTRIQDQSTSNANSIAQKAAVAALAGPHDAVETMRAEFDRRRDVQTFSDPQVRCRIHRKCNPGLKLDKVWRFQLRQHAAFAAQIPRRATTVVRLRMAPRPF